MSNYPEQFPAQPEMAPPAPTRRPGTVTAACVLAWIFSGVALLIFGFFAVAVNVNRDEFISQLQKEESLKDLDFDAGALADSITAISVLGIVLCLAAIVLAVFTFAGRSGARIGLVLCAALGAILALFMSLALFPFLWVIVCVASIVLLFTGNAGAWFKARKAA